MPEYTFKIAQAYQLAFASERRSFADDASALEFARTLEATYPLAATITVVVEPRLVLRFSVNGAPWGSSSADTVMNSRALIAASRELLEDPANHPGRYAMADAAEASDATPSPPAP